jgi:hypothetical protein
MFKKRFSSDRGFDLLTLIPVNQGIINLQNRTGQPLSVQDFTMKKVKHHYNIYCDG